LETANMHMHVLAVSVFDPTTVPEGYSFQKVRDMIESRLHLVPPFRRRLAPVPLGVNHPVWFEDPDFDLDYHVRRIGCPAPDGEGKPDRVPTDLELIGHAIVSRAKRPYQYAQVAYKTAESIVNFAMTRFRREGPGMAAPLTAPRTSINTTVTSHRKVAFARI